MKIEPGGYLWKMLNPYQRRRVSTTIRLLEENLFDIEARVSSEGRSGVLYTLNNNIPPAVKKALLDKIGIIRHGVRKIAGQFELEEETTWLRQRLVGELSLMGVSLEEIMARRLRGYGEIAEGLQEMLDPQLNALRAVLYEMLRLLAAGEKDSEARKEV
jgi:hypothetical protein